MGYGQMAEGFAKVGCGFLLALAALVGLLSLLEPSLGVTWTCVLVAVLVYIVSVILGDRYIGIGRIFTMSGAVAAVVLGHGVGREHGAVLGALATTGLGVIFIAVGFLIASWFWMHEKKSCNKKTCDVPPSRDSTE